MANRHLKPRRAAHAEPALPMQFYRQMAAMVPQMLWAARPDGATDFFNARIYEYTGRSQRQLEGWGWRSVVHPDDWERCLARWTRAFKKGQPYEVEYRLRRRDGRYFWHLGAAMPQREGGRIVRWFGTCTEIENRKHAERLLEKARQALSALVGSRSEAMHDPRFRTLVESAPVLIWQSGPDKLCTFFSKPWLEFTGRSVEQELGAGWAEGVHPDDLQRCLATYHEAFDARVPFEMEYRLRRHDGMYRWIFDRGVPLIDPVLGFQGYIGSCVDVTERRTALRDSQGHQDRLRAFMDSIPGIAWIKDSRLRYVWTSASYERILGKSLDEIRGRDDFAIWPKEMADGFRLNDEKVLRVNGAMHDVASTPLPDGSVGRWMAVKFPFPDETGALGVAGIGFDITARDGEAGADSLDDSPLARLSGRELQVLYLIVDGHTSVEAGLRLSLSPKSVDTYRSRLMAKLGIEDLPTLVKFALRHGLTTKR